MFTDKAHITEDVLPPLLRAAHLAALDHLATLTTAEQAEFQQWLQQLPQNEEWCNALTKERLAALITDYERGKVLAGEVLQAIHVQLGAAKDPAAPITLVQRIHFLKTAWFRYAAILLIILGTATYIYNINGPQKEITQLQQQTDIQHDGNRATLTLADGSVIVLDSVSNGSLASQGATNILKTAAGSLVYEAGKRLGNGSDLLYNTIKTPKGGQYHIILPDGTAVWLNAGSSIRFPAGFVKERKVYITGEVYMEVAQNRQLPFIVDIDNRSLVEVLGTHFNINSYLDEPVIQTTLLAGSIRQENKLLQPGQQLELRKDQTVKLNDRIDLNKVVAWKNGFFNFDNADLYEVLRQLKRWYDIEVIYEGEVKNINFFGEINKNVPLSTVLKTLKGAGMNFRIENERTLIVMP